MASPTRLGDLIRVIDALRPDDDQLQVIGELLPDWQRRATVEGPTRAHAAVDSTATTGLSPPRALRPRKLLEEPRRRRRRRRRTRPDRTGRRRSLLPEPGPREVAWWIAVGLVVGVLLVLAMTGRLGVLQALGVSLVLVGARPGWWYAGRGWAAWWRSPQHHSSAEREDPWQDGRAGAGDPGGIALTSARWYPPPHGEPLMRPAQQRAMATLLAGRPAPGEIDLVATVREIALRRPLTTIPRRSRWSTNQGMQLHVDIGPALEPFRHDVDQLRQALVAIAAPHAVVVLGFHGDPLVITRPRRLVGREGRIDLADRLPGPGTPVLVVTDLGIGVPRSSSPPEPAAFLDHHRLLTQAGCSVHYLVPYPPARWPRTLVELPILQWTDHLSPTEVLAGFRRKVRVQ